MNKVIAQVIAENHQGKITVESKLEQGTTLLCQFTRYFYRFMGNPFVKSSLKFEWVRKKIDPTYGGVGLGRVGLGWERTRGQKKG